MKLQPVIEPCGHIDYTGIDPSAVQQLSKYKPHYQQWAIGQIREGQNYNSIIDAVDYYITKIGDNRFQNILKKHTPSPKNILSLSLDNIKASQRDFEVTYNRLSKKERDKLKSNVLVDQPGLKIVKFEKSSPGDVDAAKAVSAAAQNTQWCVCNVETAEHYLKQGALYLLTVDGERYLCHVESNQLMDVHDDSMGFSENVCLLIVKYISGFGIFCKDKKSDVYKQAMMHNPQLAYNYAHDIIKGRWPEAEPTIMQDPVSIYNYARNIVNGRWPEAEPTIMQNIGWAYNYARDVIKGRWSQAEPTIMKNPMSAYYYAVYVIKGRWPETELMIINDDALAYYYARDVIMGRWLEAESIIIKNKMHSHLYARDVIKGRWLEAESVIMNNPEYSFHYAHDVIKGRWPEAEPTIVQNSRYAYMYARFVIKGRWPEAESMIMQDPEWSYGYNNFVNERSGYSGRSLEKRESFRKDWLNTSLSSVQINRKQK